MIGWICVLLALVVFAMLRRYRDDIRDLANGILECDNRYLTGGGMLVAILFTLETAHSLAIYTYIGPVAVTLNEYNEQEARYARDIGANVPDDVLNAEWEALNRTATKLRAMGRVGTALVTH